MALQLGYRVSVDLDFYQQKYDVLEDHLYGILRALNYFEDAEQEKQMPNMLIPVEWKKVKAFFQKETQRLAKERLGI